MFNGFLFNGAMYNGSGVAGSSTPPLAIYRRVITLPAVGLTKTDQRISNFPIGDKRRIECTYKGLTPGSEIDKAWFTVKKKEKTAPDSTAIIKKIITDVELAEGMITEASTVDGQLAMYFDIDSSDTRFVKPSIEYHWDIQIRTVGGGIHTLEIGKMNFIYTYTAAAA